MDGSQFCLSYISDYQEKTLMPNEIMFGSMMICLHDRILLFCFTITDGTSRKKGDKRRAEIARENGWRTQKGKRNEKNGEWIVHGGLLQNASCSLVLYQY